MTAENSKNEKYEAEGHRSNLYTLVGCGKIAQLEGRDRHTSESIAAIHKPDYLGAAVFIIGITAEILSISSIEWLKKKQRKKLSSETPSRITASPLYG